MGTRWRLCTYSQRNCSTGVRVCGCDGVRVCGCDGVRKCVLFVFSDHLFGHTHTHSHDVAAPLSPTLQEVAGYINYSAAFTPYLQWTVVSGGLCQ